MPNISKELSNAAKARTLAEKIFPDSNHEEQFGKEIGKLVRLEFDKYLADPIAYDKLNPPSKTIEGLICHEE